MNCPKCNKDALEWETSEEYFNNDTYYIMWHITCDECQHEFFRKEWYTLSRTQNIEVSEN